MKQTPLHALQLRYGAGYALVLDQIVERSVNKSSSKENAA